MTIYYIPRSQVLPLFIASDLVRFSSQLGKMVFLMIFIGLIFPAGSLCADILACRSLPDAWVVPDNYMASKEQENRIKALEEKVLQLQKIISESGRLLAHTTITGVPRDCGEIHRSGINTDGVFTISPDGRCPFNVYCDMSNGGWTLIQKRDSGSQSFYRSWDDYVAGFGDISGEHWLGLDKIHRLTQSGYEILFDMDNYDGTKEFAHYKSFIVHGASTLYRMNVDSFQYNGSLPELLSYHDNMKFSTFDRDNDLNSKNCAADYLDGGGWWYNSCYRLGNLNGVYGKKEQGGIGYYQNKPILLKNVQIKVKARFEVC